MIRKCTRQTSVARGHGFSLIETLVMLAALMVFTLLLAGLTKPYWGGAELTSLKEIENEESSEYVIDEKYLPDAQKDATPEIKNPPEPRQ